VAPAASATGADEFAPANAGADVPGTGVHHAHGSTGVPIVVNVPAPDVVTTATPDARPADTIADASAVDDVDAVPPPLADTDAATDDAAARSRSHVAVTLVRSAVAATSRRAASCARSMDPAAMVTTTPPTSTGATATPRSVAVSRARSVT
jgi:hypothetical protein